MSYYRVRYTATVYTSEEFENEEQLEEEIEESFDDVLYQFFNDNAYNVDCEVERRMN